MRFSKLLSIKECQEFIDYFNQSYNYADGQVRGSNIIHNSPKAMELCFKLRPSIESKLEYNLQPVQAWIRKYVKGNVLYRHWDGSADCALSIMLGQSDDRENPLLVYYEENPEVVVLDVGDGYFFEGGTIEHERPVMESEYLYGMYLGFKKVPRNESLL